MAKILKNKIKLHLLIIFIGFFGLSMIGSLYSKYYIEGRSSISIEEFINSLLLASVGLLLLGASLGVIAYFIAPNWNKEDDRKVGGGIIAGIFISNLCISGACLPASIVASVYGLIAFIPMSLGLLIAKLMNKFIAKENND